MPLVRNLIIIGPWTLSCVDICKAKLIQMSVMNLPMQLVLLASFSVAMVSVFLPLSVAMAEVEDVVMAVMKEDAVS